ncbi:DUF4192 family protein [Microbacterium oxydans]|nr:DUF4192 family protein [Microbacterium oxydans]
MTTVLRATDSAAFLGIVPLSPASRPVGASSSLPFRGSRTDGAMRLDLPEESTDVGRYADNAVGLVARVSGTDAVAVVVYTDQDAHPTRDGLVLPHAVVIDEVLGCAEDAGLRVVDALCVTPSGWSSYLKEEPELGSLAQIRLPSDLPPMEDVSGDQNVGTELPTVDLAEKERVGRASADLDALLDRHGRAPRSARENPQLIAALVLLDDVPAFPRVGAGCTRRSSTLRDSRAAVVSGEAAAARRGDRAMGDRPRGRHPHARRPDRLRRVRRHGSRRSGRRVPRTRTDARHRTPAVRPLRSRARQPPVHPRHSRPAPLTVAAWLSWALGRASHAGRYLEMVREIDPRYSLAALLETMIGGAMLPEWAFRRGPMG